MEFAYTHRPVELGDLDLICYHRHEMFKSSGRTDELLTPMTIAFRAWLEPRLRTGSYFGWIVQAGEVYVGGLGMMVIDWPPHPSHPTQNARGYILNVFVEAAHRGKGVAGSLMKLASGEAARRGLQYVILHTTSLGRPMYEKLGWQQTSEMAIALTPAD